MNPVFTQIELNKVVPVVVLNDVNKAVPIALSLINGGIPCAEVTFRTEAAEESIYEISRRCPEMILGAGTVLSVEQVDKAIGAGARFIVSPGFNPKVVEYCMKNDYPVCPGIMTPTELEMALDFGLELVKFFPAENAGGLKMIKALSAPYPMVKFMPTGGISPSNLRDYLSCDKILACGGSWMVKKELIEAGKYDEIEKLTKEAFEIVKEIRG
ncbi:MAG: bifunctional 4-hydroxy-2-oxoglutarate aldolase/2-dehydro-3-deoxy-phosphogluconate aldolase [Treponema sp.]|nr:bifunctional 4-hydroxy-2-oxoglutarate aldolase/2-dehydro-3-deoxy-phosphogluconate aldolase [Treponema sp.]